MLDAMSTGPDELSSHDLISFPEAARLLKGLGDPSPISVWRWARRGLLSRSGRRVRLDHVRVGARLFTSREALQEFFSAVAASDCEHFDRKQEAPQRTTKREREINSAERFLRDNLS